MKKTEIRVRISFEIIKWRSDKPCKWTQGQMRFDGVRQTCCLDVHYLLATARGSTLAVFGLGINGG